MFAKFFLLVAMWLLADSAVIIKLWLILASVQCNVVRYSGLDIFP